ncbi:MAG: Asp-tRNA(Asn)/Glu-tRNA(Gln) amidotransferase A subunit family amidase, partial [Myxococcota bacterium]
MDDRATSLVAQRDALASGTCSSTELIDGAIDRHDQTNASLNAVLGLRAEAAR